MYRNIGQVLGGNGGMRSISFFTSCILTSSLAIYCRFFTPFYTYSEQQKKNVYLNVNGCYEFWKVSLACPWSPFWGYILWADIDQCFSFQDIKIPFLHSCDNQHPIVYLGFLATAGNCAVNGVAHILLFLLSHSVLP